MLGRNWTFRVRHIIENIERVKVFVSGMSYETFCSDEKTAFAVVTCFSIIGEAARLVPKEVKETHPEIPWNEMARMRNVLAHEYDRIDLEIVWSTIREDLPAVLPKLQEVLDRERNNST